MPIDPRRRLFLARLGAAAGSAYLAPALLHLGMARASESFSGGSSDNSSGSGGGDEGSSPFASSYSAPPRRSAAKPTRRKEILVATSRAQDLDRLEGLGFRVLGRQNNELLGLSTARVALPANTSLPTALAELQRQLPNATVTENTYYVTSELPCADGSCSAFDMVGWHPGGQCDAEPVIGMIDTGVNPDHEALAGQHLTVVSIDQGDRQPAGRVHGTAVATLLVGSPDSRTPGLLPRARLYSAQAFFADQVGEAADSFSVIAALDLLARSGVSVINMSFAGPANPVLDQALATLASKGIGLVAAAGNGGPSAPPAYPAAHESVIAVTAIGKNLSVYRQAARGPHIALAAPGVQIWTAASISGGRYRSGTSYAAPFVTAALAVAALKAPGTPPAALLEELTRSAQDLGTTGHDEIFGWGLVQTAALCTP